jgi:hypothetical protein
MKENKEVEARIRLSSKTKSEMKKYLGDNVSKEIREVIERKIRNKKEDLDKFLTCAYCRERKDELGDMMITPYLELGDNKDADEELKDFNYLIFIICKDCFNHIARNGFNKKYSNNPNLTQEEEFKAYIEVLVTQSSKDKKIVLDEDKIAMILESNNKANLIEMYIKLIKYYPNSYCYNGHRIFIKDINYEEFSKRLDRIHND